MGDKIVFEQWSLVLQNGEEPDNLGVCYALLERTPEELLLAMSQCQITQVPAILLEDTSKYLLFSQV